MLKFKIGEKFASRVSGKQIRVLTATSNPQVVVIATLKNNGHRIASTTRAVFVDSIRRKYARV